MKPVHVIEVLIWEKRVGAASADPGLGSYAFEYDPSWKREGIELAPLTMPLSDARQTFTFPTLPKATYFGLPSMLADALPDDFGNALIDAWMATKGIEKTAVTVLDRLAYMGKRGMGAMEFRPARGSNTESSALIEMKQLVEEARRLVEGSLAVDHEAKAALANIIRVGTSAGGARAKAVIDHRLTKPKHPWTNGQVERMNRTIKEATVKRFYYETHQHFRQHLTDFVNAYNFARRLKTLRGLTPYEYICSLWTKEPQRFKLNPTHLSLGPNS